MCHVCPDFFSSMLDNRLRKLIMNPEYIVKPYIHESDIVADIGCGPGFFTIPLAKLVGPKGKVYAVDIQKGMLDKLKTNAEKCRFTDRIILHQCDPESLGLTESVDFCICFWMVHEVPSKERLFGELRKVIKNGGRLLVSEPIVHVSKSNFKITVQMAVEQGFRVESEPKIRGSYSVILN
jgi:ubiquinone/menaquinone biosynthesis C-methylase UbiE